MKKILPFILSIIFIVPVLFILASCGGGDSDYTLDVTTTGGGSSVTVTNTASDGKYSETCEVTFHFDAGYSESAAQFKVNGTLKTVTAVPADGYTDALLDPHEIKFTFNKENVKLEADFTGCDYVDVDFHVDSKLSSVFYSHMRVAPYNAENPVYYTDRQINASGWHTVNDNTFSAKYGETIFLASDADNYLYTSALSKENYPLSFQNVTLNGKSLYRFDQKILRLDTSTIKDISTPVEIYAPNDSFGKVISPENNTLYIIDNISENRYVHSNSGNMSVGVSQNKIFGDNYYIIDDGTDVVTYNGVTFSPNGSYGSNPITLNSANAKYLLPIDAAFVTDKGITDVADFATYFDITLVNNYTSVSIPIVKASDNKYYVYIDFEDTSLSPLFNIEGEVRYGVCFLNATFKDIVDDEDTVTFNLSSNAKLAEIPKLEYYISESSGLSAVNSSVNLAGAYETFKFSKVIMNSQGNTGKYNVTFTLSGDGARYKNVKVLLNNSPVVTEDIIMGNALFTKTILLDLGDELSGVQNLVLQFEAEPTVAEQLVDRGIVVDGSVEILNLKYYTGSETIPNTDLSNYTHNLSGTITLANNNLFVAMPSDMNEIIELGYYTTVSATTTTGEYQQTVFVKIGELKQWTDIYGTPMTIGDTAIYYLSFENNIVIPQSTIVTLHVEGAPQNAMYF